MKIPVHPAANHYLHPLLAENDGDLFRVVIINLQSLPTGLLVVTYLDNSHIKAASSKAAHVLFQLDVDTTYGQTNEAVFSKDGKSVYVTNQNVSKVYVVKGIPEHGLYLTGTKSVPLGGSIDLSLTGGQTGQARQCQHALAVTEGGAEQRHADHGA